MNCKMQVYTDVLDVLPDGTITRLRLTTEPMAVIISREELDQNFMVEKIDVADQERMGEALEVLADQLHDYCIYSIEIGCLDGSKTTLSI